MVGFPWRLDDDDESLYNAMLWVSYSKETGKSSIFHIYLKAFLYQTDETWAVEGPGFTSVYDQAIDAKVGLGICMDLSPYQFKAPFDKYEFGTFQKNAETRHIWCCMNWLSPLDCKPAADETVELEAIQKQLSYWMQRIIPWLATEDHDPISFAVSNRVGTERGTTFNGCSAVFTKSSRGWSVKHMDRHEEGVVIVDVS